MNFYNIYDEIKFRIKHIIVKQQKMIDYLKINIINFDFEIFEINDNDSIYNFEMNFFKKLDLNQEGILFHTDSFKKKWFNRHYFSAFEFLEDGTLKIRLGNKLIAKHICLSKPLSQKNFYNISFYFNSLNTQSLNINDLFSLIRINSICKILDSGDIFNNFEIINMSKVPNIILKSFCKDFEVTPDMFFNDTIMETMEYFLIVEKKLESHIFTEGTKTYIKYHSVSAEKDILIKEGKKYTNFFVLLTRHFCILTRKYTNHIIFNIDLTQQYFDIFKKALELLGFGNVEIKNISLENKNLNISYKEISDDFSKQSLKYILNSLDEEKFILLNEKNYISKFSIEKLNYIFIFNSLKQAHEKIGNLVVEKIYKNDLHFTKENYELLLLLCKYSWIETKTIEKLSTDFLCKYMYLLAKKISNFLKNTKESDYNLLSFAVVVLEKIASKIFL